MSIRGEHVAEACAREFAEELDLAVEVGSLRLVADLFFTDTDGVRQHDLCCYFAVHSPSLTSAEPLTSREDQLDFAWLPLDDLAAHSLIPNYLYEHLPGLASAVAQPTYLMITEP